jgi:hypothetical protein
VPEKNVPSSGREVQCSACGHTWFQTHPSLKKLQEPVKDSGQETETASEEIQTVLEKSDLEGSGQPGETNGTSSSRLHPTVAEVLKEEARREVAVRAAENLETQPELGIDEALVQTVPSFDISEPQSKEMSSILLDPDPKELKELYPKTAQMDTGFSGDRLPEQKNINYSLSPAESKKRKISDKGGQAKRVDYQRMKRRGLVTGIMIVVCFFLIYQFSGDIVQAMPQSEQLLKVYVQLVDQLRLISDQWIGQAIAWLEIRAGIARGLTE